MELKDAILSTLAEMQEGEAEAQAKMESKSVTTSKKMDIIKKVDSADVKVTKSTLDKKANLVESMPTEELLASSELMFLNSFKERLLVLFEGLQAPNNINIESKVDMTLNFLEYSLAKIDERTHKLTKGSRE